VETVGERDWQVLLLGGASGTGKSQLSYPLAQHYQVPIVEVDDLVIAVQRMTTPGQQPMVHYWDTHPDADSLPASRLVELQIAVAEALRPALDAVIGNHLQTDTPVVIEGDYLLPSLAAQGSFAGHPANGRVRSVFLHEPDPEQLVVNYLLREPGNGQQRSRAQVSARYGNWLAAQASEHRIPVLTTRPWSTTLNRLCVLLDETKRAPNRA
jgi:2-phosphoglycerate kinase